MTDLAPCCGDAHADYLWRAFYLPRIADFLPAERVAVVGSCPFLPNLERFADSVMRIPGDDLSSQSRSEEPEGRNRFSLVMAVDRCYDPSSSLFQSLIALSARHLGARGALLVLCPSPCDVSSLPSNFSGLVPAVLEQTSLEGVGDVTLLLYVPAEAMAGARPVICQGAAYAAVPSKLRETLAAYSLLGREGTAPASVRPSTPSGKLVSLIICSHNRAEMLGVCLDTLVRQESIESDVEIIVVDNGSTDGTRETVETYKASIPQLRYVYEPVLGLSNARNCGYRNSSGDYLAFLDDDIKIPEHYVTSLRAVLLSHKPDICGGPIYPFYVAPKPEWFPEKFEVRKYEEVSGFSLRCGVSGGNFIIRRSLLERLGLFDPNFGMVGNSLGMLEERKILECYRQSTLPEEQRVYYALECAIYHYTPPSKLTLSYVVERAYVTGEAACRLYRDTRTSLYYAEASMKLRNNLFELLNLLLDGRQELLAAEGGPVRKVAFLLRDMSWSLGFVSTLLAVERFPEGNAFLKVFLGYFAHAQAALTYLLGAAGEISDELLRESSPAAAFLLSKIEEAVAAQATRPADPNATSPLHIFDETAYLAANPEVAVALRDGIVPSAAEHYLYFGRQDGRSWTPILSAPKRAVKPREVDVLYLVEHVAREMDVACAVKAIAERDYGISVEIRGMYINTYDQLREFLPRIVATPFFYSAEDNAIEEYVVRWPRAKFFNLAWEEIFYEGHKALKAPHDDFTKHKVIHHAWGGFYEQYLSHYGVSKENIFVNGNPAYQLYSHPYRSKYPSREALAAQHGLDLTKRWILIPENYRWAFISDDTIQWRVDLGADGDSLREMRSFARRSLKELLAWCADARQGDLEIVVRPKPATELAEMERFFTKYVAAQVPSHLRFIKNGSVREWILAADIVISGFSTTLIEAAIAGKPCAFAEPLPLIPQFRDAWYELAPRLATSEAFTKLCHQSEPPLAAELKSWATAEMLSRGDPIARLAAELASMVREHRTLAPDMGNAAREEVLQVTPRQYFNQKTHENDLFSEGDVKRWEDEWRAALPADVDHSDGLLRETRHETAGHAACCTPVPPPDLPPWGSHGPV